jgi:hypothetical protein
MEGYNNLMAFININSEIEQVENRLILNFNYNHTN